ncbi:hypothetical protein POM88_033624 [Heracleum sosnowskyi]|uniref:Uncharacterized protein n=1 Tax=Heracleum sosnowskyi TaxID=360622 RepID=A0AAD8MC98_9APIA|nr:hypothetical protein POM88_033624 [Heracleum sosnowskyi]
MNLGELNERFVGLWNPGINRWKIVKIGRERGCGGRGDDRTCSSYGLGYDEGNDDIRIIRIVTAYVSRAEFFAKCKWAWVKIYSVNRGCWEDVDGEFSFWPSQCHCQFIVKRVLYFVGDDVMPDDPRSNQQNYILAGIDPCTRLYKKVHYPEHFRGDTWSYGHSESLVTIEGMELITKDKNKKTKPKKVNRTELLSKDFESALHL